MADYSEYVIRPGPMEWEKRYSKTSIYNAVVCKFCGSLVNEQWGTELHDDMHVIVEEFWEDNGL